MTEEDPKNKIILDSGSSIDIFRNTQLLLDIKRSNQVIHLYNNVVSKTNQMQVLVPYYVKVWYSDEAIENILSLTNLVKKYRVTYDSHQDDDFNVQTNIRIINFKRDKQGIYIFNPTYTTINSNTVITVE